MTRLRKKYILRDKKFFLNYKGSRSGHPHCSVKTQTYTYPTSETISVLFCSLWQIFSFYLINIVYCWWNTTMQDAIILYVSFKFHSFLRFIQMINLFTAFHSYLYFSSQAVQAAHCFWLTATVSCADVSKCAEAAPARYSRRQC